MYWGEDKIQIGCQQNTIEEWVNGYEAIGEQQDYTLEQIAEYKGYIDMVAAFHNQNNPKP